MIVGNINFLNGNWSFVFYVDVVFLLSPIVRLPELTLWETRWVSGTAYTSRSHGFCTKCCMCLWIANSWLILRFLYQLPTNEKRKDNHEYLWTFSLSWVHILNNSKIQHTMFFFLFSSSLFILFWIFTATTFLFTWPTWLVLFQFNCWQLKLIWLQKITTF